MEYLITKINNEYLHQDTGLLIYSVEWTQNRMSGYQYPVPFEEFFSEFNIGSNQVLFNYWANQKQNSIKNGVIGGYTNSITAKDCHILMESTWKSDADITLTQTPMVASEVYYHVDFLKNHISSAMDHSEFKAKCKRKRPRTLANKNNMHGYSNSYVDVCINVVQSVGPPLCSNLVGEYLHYLIEDRVKTDMEPIAGSVTNVEKGNHNNDDIRQETVWTKEQVARWWSIHDIQKENEFSEIETQSKIMYHRSSKIKIEDRLKKTSRLVRAMFDMFVDQTPNTELPIGAQIKEKRETEFQTRRVFNNQQTSNPSDYPYKLQPYGEAANRTLKLDVRYIDKNKNVSTIAFVNTQPSLSYWDTNTVDDGDNDDTVEDEIATYINKLGKNVLRPDILITLYDTSKATHTRTFKMGKIIDDDKMYPALFGPEEKTQNSYAFPNLSRMCAIEIKTSRGISSKEHKQTSHYIYDTITSTRNAVILKYRQSRFNGTVFILHIFYDFNYAFISQLQINDFTLLNGPKSTDLSYYYNKI
jgi:hypothetical protein